ncbi:MAG TPA: TlpA disulfide reductase family protein [Thermoanaerobaculia bacterium]|nr:TlpA disulfide reductase family protein [Thermoanaerobaculia bacterium]
MPRRALRSLQIGVVFALGICLGAAGLGAEPTPAPRTGLQVGDLAPAFSLQTLDGKTLTRDGLKGKVVLLDFWATWCGPCRQALPELKDLQKKNARQPLVIVSISVDEDRKLIESFVSSNGMSWPQAWDREGEVTAGIFRVGDFPSYLVLDAEGRIAYRQRGWGPGRSAALLEEAVSKALASRKSPAKNDIAAVRR